MRYSTLYYYHMQRLQVVTDLVTSGFTRRQALKAAIATSGIKYFRIAERLGMSGGHLSNILNGQRDATDEVLDQIEAAIADLAEPTAEATA
jgi:transcriptional regulator with XRE-family HTH domain